MGSLMSGWDSPVLDPKSAKYKRNRSLTKGEIEAYWRSKKKLEEEHLKAIADHAHEHDDVYGGKIQRSSTFPPASTTTTPTTKEGFEDTETDVGLEQLIKKNGWWTRSSWAFLNEPPPVERPSDTYTTQFHIANLASRKTTDTGISAN